LLAITLIRYAGDTVLRCAGVRAESSPEQVQGCKPSELVLLWGGDQSLPINNEQACVRYATQNSA